MVPVRWRTDRPISSIVTTAHSLATQNNPWVAYSHVQQAVKVSENFIHEFNGISVIESLLY